MRVRSDKSFLFKGDNEEVVIKKGEVKDLPDWISKTDIFNLAQKDGSILVIETQEDKKKAENDEDIKASSKAKGKTKEDSTDSPADK